jgi:RimJ/RimL family protein N-acetyltransferase
MRNADPLPRAAGDAVLRRLAIADLLEFQAYRSDPQVARYQDRWDKSDAEAREFLARMNTAELLQPGIWSQIGIANADGLLIGDIGLLLAADGKHAELGIRLRQESQGRGLGTAAAQEGVRLVFERTNARRVLGIADSRNVRSIRMLRRVGMRMLESRDGMCNDEPCIDHVYAISRKLE